MKDTYGILCVCVCVCVCICVWLGPVSGASLLWEDCSSVNMKRVCERLHVYMCHVCWQLRKTVSDRWTWSKWVSLHTRVHFSFQIHTWSHIYIFTHAFNHTHQTFSQRPTSNAQLWTAKHTHTHTPLKVKLTQKQKLLSSFTQPHVVLNLWLTFFCGTQKIIFLKNVSVFFVRTMKFNRILRSPRQDVVKNIYIIATN